MSKPSKLDYILQAFPDRPKLWRYLLGLLFVLMGYMVGSFASFGLFYAIEDTAFYNEEGAFDLMATRIHPALALVLYLILPFGFGILGLALALRVLHKRPFLSLFSGDRTIDWGRYFVGFFLWLALAIGMESLFYLINPDAYTLIYNPGDFWPLVIVGLLFFPIQTSCEEFIFRGYLLQGFGIASLRGWISILITAILFGLLHGSNPEVMKYGSVLLLYYIGVGILLGVITWMDQRIELALGLHAANNFFAAVFVTFSSSVIQTPALFRLEELNITHMMIAWVVSSGIFMLILMAIYKWRRWDALWERVEKLTMGDEKPVMRGNNT